MHEYQFAREKIDQAETRAIRAYQTGDRPELEKQARIRDFWQRQLNRIMEVQINEK